MTSDRETEAKIAYLLSRMTIEEKVGQVIQADIASVTPEQVREYNLGSVLNGGSSAPGGDNRATPDKWLGLADEFWDASIDTSDGGVGIPVLWGTDAVHGHSNILGATLFPHNIGLGMANDPDMMESIGQATALEMRVTGLDWTFAPTIAVVRNDRWGRTYESYSEDPAIVAAYAPRIIQGLQGRFGSDKFLDEAHLMATAKHFAGDGGTVDGIDQGDNQSPESVLRDQQAAAYPPAIAAGVQSVMASFNSYHGRKMHGFKPMLSDVLVGRMGFDGFVVGDWNGHGQVIGCSNTACAQSFNAGLDMFMAPDSWQGLYESMLEQLASGQILESRLDEAVSRILRVKMRARLFDAGPPSSRKFAGDYDLLASTQHRALARDAVRKSLVLLKNQNRVLPIGPGTRVLLAGDGAHNIGKQSGGWTLNWQGTGNLREHFPSGSSIYEGFVEALGADNVELAENGEYRKRPDVAVVVFGENPYAEFQGDRADVDYPSGDGLALLEGFRKAGIATVSVFISGRPLFVNPELNASDAFVAAWLPGSEGSGVADVLVADDAGEPRFDFLGRLSFSWPKLATQTEVNIGDPDYDPLFAYGYGLSYVDSVSLGLLDEDSGLASGGAVSDSVFIDYGDPVGDWSMVLRDVKGGNRIADSRGKSIGGAVSVAAADRNTQEDTVIVQWMSAGAMTIEGGPVDLAREANGDMVLQISYSVLDKGAGPVSIGMASEGASAAVVDVTEAFSRSAGQGWQTGQILLSCFVEEGLAIESVVVPLEIYSKSQMQIQIASAMIAPNPGDADCAL
ncbi:MAG: glycoside hydrolase family 3 N-terminal domain-containing protein [Pseudomonadota bacterium]